MVAHRTVLVAGSQGVIGRAAACHLAAQADTKVYGLSRRVGGDGGWCGETGRGTGCGSTLRYPRGKPVSAEYGAFCIKLRSLAGFGCEDRKQGL